MRLLADIPRQLGGPGREFRRLFTRSNEHMDLPVRPEARTKARFRAFLARVGDAFLMVILFPVMIILAVVEVLFWPFRLLFGGSRRSRSGREHEEDA